MPMFQPSVSGDAVKLQGYGPVDAMFGGVSPKALVVVDANRYYIACRKANSDATCLIYEVKQGVVTTTDSVGGAAQLFRVTQVIEGMRAFVAMHAYSGVSNIADWSQVTYAQSGQAGAYGTGAWGAAVKVRRTTVQNAWMEFTAVAGPSGTLTVGFATGSNKASGCKVSIDGVDLGTFSTVSDTSGVWKKAYSVSPGSHVVRVTKTDAGSNGLECFGVNFFDFFDLPTGNTIDSFGYGRSANFYKTSSVGAIDYAMKAYGGLWSGSYHGGETRTALKILVDGVDVTASAAGSVVGGKHIEFRQATSIATGAGTVTTESSHVWSRDGGHIFNATLQCGSIAFDHLYTMMDVLDVGFNKLVYPLAVDFSGLVSTTNTVIGDGKHDATILENPTTGQRAGLWSAQADVTNNTYGGLRVRSVPGTYHRPYNGPIVESPVPVTAGNVTISSMHAYG